MVNTDACLNACKAAKCGDGIVQMGVEECDDGNMVNNDGCSNMCTKGPSCGTLVTTWNGWSYYKVTVNGTMIDANVRAACEACGLKVPCQALDGCSYNDNICLQTTNETSCGNPMLGLANLLCSANPSSCPSLYNTYQYMGLKWVGTSACGAKAGQWCVQGSSYSNEQGLCVLPK
jgi:cysteine-rich repeat protein